MTHNEHPSIYVNRTICSAGSTVRLIFIDSRGEGNEHVRASLALSYEDAIETYKLLKRMLIKDTKET